MFKPPRSVFRMVLGGFWGGFAQGLGQVPHHPAISMDVLLAVTLLLLVVTHGLLVHGCNRIHSSLPKQTDVLAGRLDRTSDLLDEMAQLIADLGDATAAPMSAQGPLGFADLLTAFLNSRTALGPDDATKSKQWEVLSDNENPPQTV